MFRHVLSGLTIGLFLVATTPAQTQDRPRAARTNPQARVPGTLRLLNQRIPEVSFQEAPFEQVMEWVADFTQANVVVRWQTLDDAGIDREKPITIKVKNLRLSQVLWMIMNEAAGSDLKLAYRASGNLIVLSTEEDLNKEMVVRVYDVGDLLVFVPRFTNAARLDPGQALNQLGQGGTGGGGGQSQLFETDRDDENSGRGGTDTGNTSMEELIQLIVETLEPETWQQNGGAGSIRPFQNHLVVRNTLLVHQRIGGYVEEGVAGE